VVIYSIDKRKSGGRGGRERERERERERMSKLKFIERDRTTHP